MMGHDEFVNAVKESANKFDIKEYSSGPLRHIDVLSDNGAFIEIVVNQLGEIGVEFLTIETLPFTGYENIFNDFESALSYIRGMLNALK